ncbi:hypothetical protein CTI12_AA254500 [Artemisia annua]|uniref:DUF7731 domain-containing protein n=1 Tax=Artemisia annua TaxID=35608 RepID=A0A2U1NL13_ARTAN|nr:hypothetical protein CTI12_AA254500 [Artemisia annua]
MKSSQMLMLFGLFYLCFLQIPSSNASSFNYTYPEYNINLAPFIQRKSAYYCLKRVSPDCPGNLTLSTDGWLNISSSETQQFCQGPCKQHTLDVLKCVWYVKHDYKFDNKATIQNINETINNGCEHGEY